MADENKYEILGVAEDADQREIRTAYRKLAMQHHPDKGGDTAIFQKIQGAYETLGDEDSRQQYDHQRRNPQQFAKFGSGGGGFDGFGGFPGFGGFSFFGGGGGGFPGGGFPGGGFPGGGFPGGGFPGGGFPGFDAGDDGFGDEAGFEDFINFNFFNGGQSQNKGKPSWFFDFDMNDDEYFSRQEDERARRREEKERFAEEQREKRKAAKEQWRQECLKRQQERPEKNHKKTLRKNVLKLIDKEAPEIRELNQDELDAVLDGLSIEQLKTLWTCLESRGSMTVLDCVVDAFQVLDIQLAFVKQKKTKKKSAGGNPPTGKGEAGEGKKAKSSKPSKPADVTPFAKVASKNAAPSAMPVKLETLVVEAEPVAPVLIPEPVAPEHADTDIGVNSKNIKAEEEVPRRPDTCSRNTGEMHTPDFLEKLAMRMREFCSASMSCLRRGCPVRYISSRVSAKEH